MATPNTNAAPTTPEQLRANRMNYARGVNISQAAQTGDASYNLQQDERRTRQALPSNTSEADDAVNDPVYRLKAAAQQAKEEAKSAALTATSAAGDQLSKQAASKWVAWQWTSIPAILTGAGILDFLAAVLASYVALIRTLVEKEDSNKTVLGFSAGLLPPAFEFMPGIAPIKSKDLMGMASGFMEFLFFITAHLILLLLIVAGVMASVIVALPYIVPLIAAGGVYALFFDSF